MNEYKDFMGVPLEVGDHVYRNEKLHVILRLPKRGSSGSDRATIDLIYPSVWKKPQTHPTWALVKIPPKQMTAFLMTHTLPQKYVKDV